jgi:hypothetical protein
MSDFGDVDSLYKVLKKKVDFKEVEGVAQVCDDQEQEVELVLYGPKDSIDEVVDAIDEVAMKEEITVSVEPFLKEEDFRGVFRFIQRD